MTSFAIKIIAIIAMTLDHLAKIVGQRKFMSIIPGASYDDQRIHIITYIILNTMETIGRIAFPLFAFFIVEGTRKTRSLPKYIGRLFLFALISEPCYYFAFGATPTPSGFLRNLSRLHFTNVFFTLALGAAMIWVFELVEKKYPAKKWFIDIPVLLLFMLIAGRIECDYFYFGILLIGALWFAGDKKKSQMIVMVTWSFIIYILYFIDSSLNPYQLCYMIFNMISASMSALLVWFYNGKRGPRLKWGFYIYYPAHIALILYLSSLITPIEV